MQKETEIAIDYGMALTGFNQSLTVNMGTTATLVPTFAPTNATIKTVTWSSSDTTIATVSTTGVITPKAVGTATITATTTDGGYTASATVTIVQPVTSITLNKTALTLKVGDPNFTLVATVSPTNATDKTVTATRIKSGHSLRSTG